MLQWQKWRAYTHYQKWNTSVEVKVDATVNFRLSGYFSHQVYDAMVFLSQFYFFYIAIISCPYCDYLFYYFTR